MHLKFVISCIFCNTQWIFLQILPISGPCSVKSIQYIHVNNHDVWYLSISLSLWRNSKLSGGFFNLTSGVYCLLISKCWNIHMHPIFEMKSICIFMLIFNISRVCSAFAQLSKKTKESQQQHVKWVYETIHVHFFVWSGANLVYFLTYICNVKINRQVLCCCSKLYKSVFGIS